MAATDIASVIPTFCQGIDHFADALPGFEAYGKEAELAPRQTAIAATEYTPAI
ncbi:MAG: hypothetical protein AAGG51_22145 [Cyanobacteria bacterium P01_G01_bin.54]